MKSSSIDMEVPLLRNRDSRIWTSLGTPSFGAQLVLTSIFNYNSMIVAVMLYGTWWWSPWRARKGLAWAQQAF